MRTQDGRRRLGAFYTPPTLALAVLRVGVKVWRAIRAAGHEGNDSPRSLLDPSCGDGRFLQAAAAELGNCEIVGVDVDSRALEVAGTMLGASARLMSADALDPQILAGEEFDLIVGNPPYGLRRSDARVWGLDCKRTDSYAVFLAMGLSRLAPGGVLAFITADTWLTVRSHFTLRELLVPNLHSVTLLPTAAFGTTVNTCLVVVARFLTRSSLEGTGKSDPSTILGSVRTGDLSRVELAALPQHLEAMPDLKWPAPSPPAPARKPFESVAPVMGPSCPLFWIPRGRIVALERQPIFVGSPRMADLLEHPQGDPEEIAPGYWPCVSTLFRHGKSVRLVRLGDIAASPHGISTGANERYIRVIRGGRGRYLELEAGMQVAADRLARLTAEERREGIDVDWQAGMGCYVPLDKGIASHANEGWLPNYYVPTHFYVNWARGALADMRKNAGFSWKNWGYFFRSGLTFSVSGLYAPTFRLGACGVFEAKGSGLFCEAIDSELLLGILCSRVAKYLFKVFLKHSVDTSGDDVARFPLVLPSEPVRTRIRSLVGAVIRRQRDEPNYPYQRFEQIQLDHQVAKAYGLDKAEMQEVDAWHARRYPLLDSALGVGARLLP